MKKSKLVIFDENNQFVRILVNPTQEEMEANPNSLLNPRLTHVLKFPMESWEKEGNQIIVRDKKKSNQVKNIKREEIMTEQYKEVEVKIKQVMEYMKNQNLDIECLKKENKKLAKRDKWVKIAIVSILLNLLLAAPIINDLAIKYDLYK